MKIGLNMFSLHAFTKTEEDYLDTLKKVKEMGYDFIQFSGVPYSLELVKKGIELTNLPVYLTHFSYDKIVNEIDSLMDDHDAFGCKNIGLGCATLEQLKDEEKFKAGIQKLNEVAKYIEKRGFKFFYHNHDYEFKKMKDGRTFFDYIIEEAPYINFTLDTYWLQLGGVNILEYIEKTKGRIDCIHLKDVKLILDNETQMMDRVFACLGEGNLNFKEIVAKANECGAKYFFVEQDNASYLEKPFYEVEKSVKYIKNNF